ncbi:hypothetical protein P7C73_g5081, partial [Tremellales sp. Uapishka_1]
MADVFKTAPQAEIVTDLLDEYRLKAIDILQNVIPARIVHIKSLLEQETSPDSVIWPGHIETHDYVRPRKEQVMPSLKVQIPELVLPDEIVRAKGGQIDDGGDEDGGAYPGKEEKGDVGVRGGVHWFEYIPQNDAQVALIKICTNECNDMHMMAQDLKIWLEMEVPVIEDGNSFGAEVQHTLIKELAEVYRKSNAMHNGCRAHYSDRLKLCQDWVRFPNLMDYAEAIAASDRFDHFLLRSYLRSMLNVYSSLILKFQRNWTKVINPKGSHSGGGMY